MPFQCDPLPDRGPLDQRTLDQLFDRARTFNTWQDRPVTEETIRELYDHFKWAPTSANMFPGRFVFLVSPEAKSRIKPFLFETNAEKVMRSPCCVIVARDLDYLDHLPQLMPLVHEMILPNFKAIPGAVEDTVVRNATLQGAYLTIAARALGLDCAPMSGFDNKGVDQEFFPDGRWQSDYLVNIGYGEPSTLWPRNPRLEFEQACRIL
jgi:3-hydroxypropanoate dehydrogenase